MAMQGTDMKVAEMPKEGLTDHINPDAYEEWLEAEGVSHRDIKPTTRSYANAESNFSRFPDCPRTTSCRSHCDVW